MKTSHRVRTDYKTPIVTPGRSGPNLHWGLRWTALGVGCAVLGVVMARTQPLPGDGPPRPLDLPAARMQLVELPLPATLPPQPTTGTEPAQSVTKWQTLSVRRGDSLGRMLRRAGIGRETVYALARAGELGHRLNRLYPGDTIELALDADGELARLHYAIDPERKAVFVRAGDSFSARVVEQPLERRVEYASGVIETSLFGAGAEAGLDDGMIMDLVGIFGWDIDFVLDIREGDRFTVVYEGLYKNGEHVRNGDILAAEFVNRGQVHRAVRYTTADGDTEYYAPDGASMRKAFMRNPVKFNRITSGFGKRRHPTLGTMRNHDGVDYAARRGTPIRATGDGRIVRRGRHGGYGNTVEIRHGGRFSTLYAHMSRFARGQGVGRYVEQGDIIGYVGSTGMSTGPHLHYEFRVNGVHRNPLTVRFPSSDPVPGEQLDHFRRHARPLLAQLDTLDRFYAQLSR